MEVITREFLAKTAAARFKAQYPADRDYGHHFYWDPKEVAKKLVALGDDPTPEQVDAAIGNAGWTAISCDECNQSVDQIVFLGEIKEYESTTFQICKSCLTKATKAIKEKPA